MDREIKYPSNSFNSSSFDAFHARALTAIKRSVIAISANKVSSIETSASGRLSKSKIRKNDFCLIFVHKIIKKMNNNILENSLKK